MNKDGMMIVDEAEIVVLVEKISTACDGHSMGAILLAITDLFHDFAESYPQLTIDGIMTDFYSLNKQRHGDASPTAH